MYGTEKHWETERYKLYLNLQIGYKLGSGCQPKSFEVICILSSTVLGCVGKLIYY